MSNVNCPACNFKFKLPPVGEEEISMVREALLSNKDFMRQLGQKAGEQYAKEYLETSYQAGITAALEALGEDDDPDSNQDFNYKKWAQHRNRLRDEVRTRIEKLREDNHDT